MKRKRIVSMLLVFILSFTLVLPACIPLDVGPTAQTPVFQEGFDHQQASEYIISILRNLDTMPPYVPALLSAEVFLMTILLRLYLAYYVGLDLKFFLHGCRVFAS